MKPVSKQILNGMGAVLMSIGLLLIIGNIIYLVSRSDQFGTAPYWVIIKWVTIMVLYVITFVVGCEMAGFFND